MTAAEPGRVPASYIRLDNTLPHQIRIAYGPGCLYVSCTCQRVDPHGGSHHRGGFLSYLPIATISTAEEALTIWHQHHQENP